MTNTEILLSVSNVVLPILTYFAGVQRGRMDRQEDRARHEAEREEARQHELEAERAKRVGAVVDRYRDLATRYVSANLMGMLKAGVLSLSSSDEVAEACRLIDTERLQPAIPPTYRADLEGADLLRFFQLFRDHANEPQTDSMVREVAKQAREARGTKAAPATDAATR